MRRIPRFEKKHPAVQGQTPLMAGWSDVVLFSGWRQSQRKLSAAMHRLKFK
jgi:hypothetical protein